MSALTNATKIRKDAHGGAAPGTGGRLAGLAALIVGRLRAVLTANGRPFRAVLAASSTATNPAAPSAAPGARNAEVARSRGGFEAAVHGAKLRTPPTLERREPAEAPTLAHDWQSVPRKGEQSTQRARLDARFNLPHHLQSRLRVVEHLSHHPHSPLFDVLEPLLTFVFAAVLAALVLGNVGCACGPSTPSDPPPAVVRVSPAPSWWAPTSSGAILSASTSGGEFTLQETTSSGTRVLFRKETNYGALQVEREPTHDALILVGLHPDRVPVLYTAFLPGLPPVEFFRCAPTRPAARVSVGGADETGFWVALDGDCAAATTGALLVRIDVRDGIVRAHTPVPFGGPSVLESRRVLLHPNQRLATVLDVDATHVIRFDERGQSLALGAMPAQAAKFVGFLPDAPVLLTQDSLADGGTVLSESALGTAGGVVTTPSAFPGVGRVFDVRGTASRAVMLTQGGVDLVTREQRWRVLVRSGSQMAARDVVTPLGAQVRVALAPDGGIAGYTGSVERDGGASSLRVSTLP